MEKKNDYQMKAFIISIIASLLIVVYFISKSENTLAIWIGTVFIGMMINLIYLFYKEREDNAQEVGGAVLAGVLAAFVLTIFDSILNGY